MSIIRIKRSTVSGNPGTLANGELAYSGLTNNGSNGGDRLYIGLGTETGGNAANHYVVGGKYYTDLMAGTAGTLNVSASTSFGSVPILSQTGTIDQWLVGNLKLTGNTLSTTNSGGNLILSPNGAGLVQINGTWTLPATAGTNGYVLTTNGSGVASWQQSSSNLSIAGTAGTGSISLLTQSLTVTGNSAISTNASNQSITVSVATATTSVLGVASFSSANFTVNSGAVSITNGGITNAQLTASTITINGTAVSIGTSATISAVITNPLTISTGLNGTSYNGSSAVTIWLNTATLMASAATAYSLANTSTTYVGRSVLADSATTAAFATTATSAATAYSWVGGVVGNTSTFNAPVTFSFPVTFNGTSTYVLSTNTIYTDNLIELHTPPGGVGSFWNSDDGKDIGLRFHYYTNSTDTNAALVLANDTKMLEFYNSGAESITGTFAGASYGGFKLGNIQLVSTTANSNNATSGALTVAGGVGVGGSIFVSGVVTATTFIGALTGTASTATSAATAYALANTSTTYVGRSVLADTATTATSAATAYALSYTIQPAGGGTGVTTYAAYDLLYGTTSGPLGKLTMGTAGQVLQVNTSGSALIYGDIDGGTY